MGTCKGNILFLFVFFLLSKSALADGTPMHLRKIISKSEPKFYSVGMRGGYGVIIPHRASMLHLVTGHVISNELFIEKCNSDKPWNGNYGFPTYGFSFYFGYLANPEVLGNALALDYFTNLHLIKHKSLLFDLRLSTGVGYLTKNFNPEFNNQNVAIGSKINISIGASFDFKWQLNQSWQIGTGLSLKHFSNGSFTTPNLGINIPVLMVTAKKVLARYPREYIHRDSTMKAHSRKSHTPEFGYLVMAGYGAREIPPPGGKKMGVYALEANVRWYKSVKTAYLAGADIIHNVALYQHSLLHDSTFTGTQKDITQFAVNIGYAQVFDKFELYIVNAFYVHSVSKKDGPVYQRIGGRYYTSKNMAIHFALKTHFAKADYFEIGLGYYFKKKPKKATGS